MTLSAQVMHTHRADPAGAISHRLPADSGRLLPVGQTATTGSATPPFRSPAPVFFEAASSTEREEELSVVQAYIGYSRVGKDRAITVKRVS